MSLSDFQELFQAAQFIDSQDPYKLALVKAGQKKGELVYDLNPGEIEQGAQLPSQGKDRLEAKLKELDVPYFTREERVPVDDAYDCNEITVFAFYVAHKLEWLQEYEPKLEDGSDCYLLGEFQGYPDCCVTEFCNGTPDYLEEHTDYLEAVTIYSSTTELEREETELLTVLPEISHFPCTLTCEESLTMAGEFLTFFKTQYPEAANYYRELIRTRMNDLEVRIDPDTRGTSF